MSLIIFIAASIDISRLPLESTDSVLFIISVFSFIHVAVLLVCSFTPFSFAVLHPAFEITDVHRRVFPFVLAKPMRFAFLVCASVDITISKHIRALPMFQTVLPLALIPIAVFPLVDAVAVGFRLFPFSDVRITKDTSPDPFTFFKPCSPLSFIHLAIDPVINTFSMRFVVFKLSFVSISVAVPFKPYSVSVIIQPVAFIKSLILV